MINVSIDIEYKVGSSFVNANVSAHRLYRNGEQIAHAHVDEPYHLVQRFKAATEEDKIAAERLGVKVKPILVNEYSKEFIRTHKEKNFQNILK